MSLRTKQALILFFTTALPFGMGAAAVGLVVEPAYRKEVRRSSVETSRRLSEQVAWVLARDLERLEKMAAWEEARHLIQRSRMTQAQAQALEQAWPGLLPGSETVRTVTGNTVARELRWWRDTGDSIAELLVTDRQGRVLAASGKTTDFLQGDEAWWREAYAGGEGKVYLSDVLYDASVKSWVLYMAAPVYVGGAPGTRAIGVMKASLDVDRAFGTIQRVGAGGSGDALLTDSHGRVILSPTGGPPLSQSLSEVGIRMLRAQPESSLVVRTADDTFLYAWAGIPLKQQIVPREARLPELYVVTRRSTEEAFGPLRRVHRWMLGIGLFTIAVAVLLGSWLADRYVLRHVRALATGMRELARGEFDEAARIADQLVGEHSAGAREEREPAG